MSILCLSPHNQPSASAEGILQSREECSIGVVYSVHLPTSSVQHIQDIPIVTSEEIVLEDNQPSASAEGILQSKKESSIGVIYSVHLPTSSVQYIQDIPIITSEKIVLEVIPQSVSTSISSTDNDNIHDEIGSSDDADADYLPSDDKESFENEEMENDDGEDDMLADPPVLNDASSKKKGRGRCKVEETDKTRKRKRNPESWSRNKRREARVHGKPYISTKEQFVSGRCLKPACTCRLKCNEKNFSGVVLVRC
ncbi:unnamed protein product [Psylliodes chrysocephalus]|uniref:Uncharacterized protein n=1 Tax=Psylliodes chrysocephalus TaxID=3402493 RepID=A0A9P0CZP4_9CUCU|nr:unnamed protein product [Psylliodes chrysocephala]